MIIANINRVKQETEMAEPVVLRKAAASWVCWLRVCLLANAVASKYLTHAFLSIRGTFGRIYNANAHNSYFQTICMFRHAAFLSKPLSVKTLIFPEEMT